jgi:hypothetical protein
MSKKTDQKNERTQIVEELYAPVRIHFPRRRIEVRNLTDLAQSDLADMSKLASKNKGHKFFLLLINCFSRKIYCVPIKDKSGKNVANALLKILNESGERFKLLHTDRGREYYNKEVKEKVLIPYNIHHYSTTTLTKASLAERYILTCKRKLYKEMDKRGTLNWINLLDEVVKNINNTPHSRFGFIPNNINKSNEKKIFKKFYSQPRPFAQKLKFKLGDKVRVSDPPKMWRRGFMPHWSVQIYTIVGINKKIPPTYKLEDAGGKAVDKTYYTEELQRVKYPDVYLIEKIVAKKGDRTKVRYLGYGSEYDEWISNNNIIETEK